MTAGLVEQPRQRDLNRLDALLLRQLDDALDDFEIRVLVVQPLAVVVGLRAERLAQSLFRAVPGQESARQRAPRNDADALFAAERNHLPLFFAIDQVVVVLHRDEPRPAVPLRDMQRLRELIRVHARRADVARLAALHDVVQRFDRLLDRRVVVPAMDLIQIDVVGAEAAQRVVDRFHDVFARQAAVVRLVVPDREEDLRGDDDLVALREIAKRAADDLLAHAVRIHVRGVEEVDARLERFADERPALLLVQRIHGRHSGVP